VEAMETADVAVEKAEALEKADAVMVHGRYPVRNPKRKV
jgi:hypothetical protein